VPKRRRGAIKALSSSIFSFIHKYLLPPLRVVERELNIMRQDVYTQPEWKTSECARGKLMNNIFPILYVCSCLNKERILNGINFLSIIGLKGKLGCLVSSKRFLTKFLLFNSSTL
jgi:hypothetical protein